MKGYPIQSLHFEKKEEKREREGYKSKFDWSNALSYHPIIAGVLLWSALKLSVVT